MKKPYQHMEGTCIYRQMTVAHIREAKGIDYVEVVFLESSRFYRLLKENRAYDETLRMLRDSMAKRQVLKVRFASLESDVIEETEKQAMGISND
jgi:hypothetical protein